MGNFTARGLVLAIEMVLAVFVGMTIREFARATMSARLGDPTPRLWGRVSLRPKAWFEPFGSGLIPGLIAILWAVQILVVPAAYAKPAPVDPSYLRRQPRDTVLASIAGPVANLVLAIAGGLAARLSGAGGDGPFLAPATDGIALAFVVFAYTNAALFVFHLLPIPGLDGARMVALLLPANIRDSYRNFDRYLPLMILLVIFLIGGLTLTFLDALAGAVCSSATGVSCQGVMSVG
ncbi:MAG: site-2 protease family protein [Actinomycetota bacterium]